MLAGRGYQILQVSYVLTSFWFMMAALLGGMSLFCSIIRWLLKGSCSWVTDHAKRALVQGQTCCRFEMWCVRILQHCRFNWYFLHAEFDVKSEDKTFACWYSNFWPLSFYALIGCYSRRASFEMGSHLAVSYNHLLPGCAQCVV